MHGISLWHRYFFQYFFLCFRDGASKIAFTYGEFHPNEPAVVVAVNKRRAGDGSDRGNFIQGYLASVQRRYENILDLIFRSSIRIGKTQPDIKLPLAFVHD